VVLQSQHMAFYHSLAHQFLNSVTKSPAMPAAQQTRNTFCISCKAYPGTALQLVSHACFATACRGGRARCRCATSC
jgi:hypothetical protein